MRILLLTNLFPTVDRPHGGVFVQARINAMRAAGEDVTAVALVPRAGRLTTQILRSTGRDRYAVEPQGSDFVHAIHGMSLMDYRVNGRRYPAELVARAADAVEAAAAGSGFDVVQGHGMFMAAAGAVARDVAGRLRLPFVVSMHGSDVNYVMPRMADEYAEQLRHAAATIYVSEQLRSTAVEMGAPMERSHVIPNGVDLVTFSRSDRGGDDKTVTYVGNLYTVKGADRLPAIFRAIVAQEPRVRFRVVGDGSLRGRLERDTSDLPVVFTGRLTPAEVSLEMSRAQVLVAPSRNEGWPCVVLEAHATGTPVVGTAVGGMPEAIGDAAFVEDNVEHPEAGIANRVVAVLRGELEASDLEERALGFGWPQTVGAEIRVLRHVVAQRESQ